MQYSAKSLDEVAAFFEKLADDQEAAVHGMTGVHRHRDAKARAYTYRACAAILRDTVLVP
jgi:hypothetical protein